MLRIKVRDICPTDLLYLSRTITNLAVRPGVVMHYSPPGLLYEYIFRYAPLLYARRLAMMPVGKTLTVNVGTAKRETEYAGWRRRHKH